MEKTQTFVVNCKTLGGQKKTFNCERVVRGRGFGPKRDGKGNFITIDGITIKKSSVKDVVITLNTK